MYYHILSLFIFSRVILLLICKIQFAFFRLENDLGEIETSSNFIPSFYLKMCFDETSYLVFFEAEKSK